MLISGMIPSQLMVLFGATRVPMNAPMPHVLAIVMSSGNGVSKPRNVWAGGTSAVITFGDVIPSGGTVCSATRFSGAAMSRILQGTTMNWLIGHHTSSSVGVAYFKDGWVGGSASLVSPNTNWVMMCAIL